MTQNILEDLVRTDDGVLRVSAATKLGSVLPRSTHSLVHVGCKRCRKASMPTLTGGTMRCG